MPSSTRLWSVTAALLFGFAACSSKEPIGSYPDGSAGNKDVPVLGFDVTPSPYCLAFGQPCAKGADCCSTLCDPATLTCAASINVCTATGGGCAASTECCSLICSGNRCSAGTCIADGQACTDSASCCGGNCAGGVCQPLNPGASCRTAGNPCTASSQVLLAAMRGRRLQAGLLVLHPDRRRVQQQRHVLLGRLRDHDRQPRHLRAATLGLDLLLGRRRRNGVRRLQQLLQPAVRALRPERREDLPAGQRLPGQRRPVPPATATAAAPRAPACRATATSPVRSRPGKAIGICRNPLSCNPQGNVCHYKDYTCSVSSARNNCCAAVGNSGVCQLDFLGVPRCNGLGDTCIPAAGICSSAMDCCNLAPCVPDGTGLLRCYGTPPGIDGGVTPPSCVPVGGPCSITADCCVGYTCIEPPGSTQGICGIPQPPPGGTDAGVPDGAVPVCAEYGQLCTTGADCCNQVPCTCQNAACTERRCVVPYVIP